MKPTRSNIALLLLFMLLAACSPNKQFSVLSFFFDGVPSMEDSVNTNPVDTLLLADLDLDSLNYVMTSDPSMYYHKPYQEKKCMECHDKNAVGELLYDEPQLCYSCHENFNTKYEKLHGPVDLGFCTVCHEPHMSENKKLQKNSGNALCFPCHVSYEIEQPDTHVEIGDDLCGKCHNPHGEKPIEKLE